MSKRNIQRPVTINVRQDSGSDQETYTLGTVEPPKVNGIPVYQADDTYRGVRTKGSNEPMHVADALDELWAEWQEAVEHPDSDSQFLDWLVEEKGWTTFDMPNVLVHEIVT